MGLYEEAMGEEPDPTKVKPDPMSLDNLPYDPDDLYSAPLVEITQSSMTTFLECPQKFVLRYLMKIVPVAVSIPLVVGTGVHSVFEYLLSPKNKDNLARRRQRSEELIDKVFDKVVEASDVAWAVNDNKLEHGRAQAHAIARAWPIVYNHHDMFKMLHTELVIRKADHATIGSPLLDRGAGKIDGVVQSVQDDEILLLEHKTRHTLRDLDFVNGLALDHQALWYLMLYRNWMKDKKNAKRVKIKKLPTGFFYDAIAKPMHRSGDTFEELVQRMTDALITEPDKYFSLTPVIVEQEAVDRAHGNFEKIVKRMDGLTPDNVEMNTKSCNNYGGCPYRKLCCAGAEVSNPRKVLSLPQLDMYRFQGEHNELEEEDEL